MTQQIKNRFLQFAAFAIAILLPWWIGIKEIFGYEYQIQPINLNKPILWAQVISFALMVHYTFKAVVAAQNYSFDEEMEEPKEDAPEVELDRMYVSNHNTGEITWGNITPEVIKSIIDDINKDRYTLSWYQLEEIKKQHKETKQIVLHINNLQRPWVRNDFDKDMSLTELGYLK